MGKYEKRRVFKQLRKDGVPFLLAVKVARLFRDSNPAAFMQLEEFKPEFSRSCDCCGLPYVTFTVGERKYTLDVYRKRFF